MSYLKIQNHEGNDLVTVDLNTGHVEILAKENLGDAAYAFWDAVNTCFGQSPQEDIVIQGGKEKEEELIRIGDDHTFCPKSLYNKSLKEYLERKDEKKEYSFTGIDYSFDSLDSVSMGYSDEEYDPGVPVEDWWNPAKLHDPRLPEGRIDHIEGYNPKPGSLAEVLTRGNKTDSNLDSFDVDKLREQVDYALENPDYSGETLSLSKAYDNKLTIDVDGPGDIVFQAAKKPSP
jgi:hypothetical protein